jgi:hypothetical protein
LHLDKGYGAGLQIIRRYFSEQAGMGQDRDDLFLDRDARQLAYQHACIGVGTVSVSPNLG